MDEKNFEAEFEEIRAKFSNSLKIIRDQGDLKAVLHVEFFSGEIRVSLYLYQNPETIPNVFVKSISGKNSEIGTGLQNILEFKLNESSNFKFLELFQIAENYLQNSALEIPEIPENSRPKKEFPLNSGSEIPENSRPIKEFPQNSGSQIPGNSKGKKESPKMKAKNKPENELETDFRPQNSGMKTAADVGNRIKWDPEIPAENFIVGYLDRFVGILEIPFVDFSAFDFATADPNDFAIPEHRIQYFKYKTKKVWDKQERVDLIFGSTGSSQSIFEVMKEENAKE